MAKRKNKKSTPRKAKPVSMDYAVKESPKEAPKEAEVYTGRKYRCFMFNIKHKKDWFHAPVRGDDMVICPECKCIGSSDTFARKYREWVRKNKIYKAD